jgi:hypothetical protein
MGKEGGGGMSDLYTDHMKDLATYNKQKAALAEKDKEIESKEKALDNNEATIRRLSSEIARLKGLLAEAVAALETILFLSDAPSCHAVARTRVMWLQEQYLGLRKQERAMTDLELTERCAKWIGLEYETEWCGEVTLITRTETYLEVCPFDPLHDWNDLMAKVVPKLISDRNIGIVISRNGFVFEGPDAPDTSGKFPDDFPRAILELIAEMEEK